jgi:hypothetical protein
MDRESGFSMAFPEGWTLFEKNGERRAIGARSVEGDSIVVTIDPLTAKYSGQYKQITEIPGYAEYLETLIVQGLKAHLLASGTRELSGRKALWNRFARVPGGGTAKVSSIFYQAQVLEQDHIYAITIKVSARGRAEALKKFSRLRGALEKCLMSFRLQE